jgi:2-hydroxychromene-2-carboxylate isomerase
VIEFWFEFASTYSYVAAMQIEAKCRSAGVALAWRPFSLGPIFALQGWDNSHFNLNPRRGAYMWRDLERLTAKFGLPWQRPSAFPRPTTLPLRVAAAFADEPWCADFIRAVFVANFGEDREIGERAVVAEILADGANHPTRCWR